MSDLRRLVKKVHLNALNKGWWEGPEREAPTLHMLMVSEIAEATEEVRKDNPPVYGVFKCPGGIQVETRICEIREKGLKPDGEAVELADCVIRIMDYFGRKDWDLESIIKLKMDYNESRSHRHGGKKY